MSDPTDPVDSKPPVTVAATGPDFIHRAFANVQHGVASVVDTVRDTAASAQTYVQTAMSAVNVSQWFKSVEPELDAVLAKLLPDVLAEDVKSLADHLSPKDIEVFEAVAGRFLAKFFVAYLSRIAVVATTAVTSL